MKKIILITLIFLSSVAWSQPVLRYNTNSTLKLYNASHAKWNLSNQLNKWQKKDTLKLPFFDDFVSTKVYPDSSKWFNNYVFVNNDFPIKPPSYGVATFDDLDQKGNPYQELNILTYGPCDTLTSLAINLRDSSGRSYLASDSIYISFYFQRQGNGDPSDTRDSFILQFKDNAGNWNTKWKVKGGSVSPFAMVMISITDTKYFYKGFQFRFLNFARHTGNVNQWHIDYVHLAANRKKAINYYDDIAIQSRPTSLLLNFFEMPYNHFQADSANQKAKMIFVNASNLHNVIKNVQARHTETNNGIPIISSNLDSNNANLPAQDTSKRRFQGFSLNNLTGSPVVIKREYEIRESGIASKYPINDKITVYQEFGSCYAYDDGTAEYGFGYDDDVIDPFYQGAIAYKFNLTKADSLWAIGMFFNRSIKSTRDFKFDLKVWQKISDLGKGRLADVPIFTQKNLSPVFTDSINGYHVFILDTTLFLPKGDFFIGWEQVGNFHLDVGYDINNGHHLTESSDNLFWADRGNWTKVNFLGALMMRPYVGPRIKLGKATFNSVQTSKISVYPNPFTNHISIQCDFNILKVSIYDVSGKQILESSSNKFYLYDFQPCIYSLKIISSSGKLYNQKIVKLP